MAQPSTTHTARLTLANGVPVTISMTWGAEHDPAALPVEALPGEILLAVEGDVASAADSAGRCWSFSMPGRRRSGRPPGPPTRWRRRWPRSRRGTSSDRPRDGAGRRVDHHRGGGAARGVVPVTRVGRLAARLGEVEELIVNLRARVETLELVVRPPTHLGEAFGPYDNGGDDQGRGGAS